MADGQPPAESHATGSQRPFTAAPPPRHRQLGRASTFAEGTSTSPTSMRRRSSVLSDISEARFSVRSSADNLLRPGGHDLDKLVTEEPSPWHSAPLAFAILPAVGGLLFQNGSAVVTDVLLLGLSSIFLNWCVRAPWDWYHAAQQTVQLVPEVEHNDTIIEEDSDYEDVGETADKPADTIPPADNTKPDPSPPNHRTAEQGAALSELNREELMALVTCFLGPLVGAYLLHTIRYQLSRPSEGLVSNYNLTIFVMAAELRPFSHLLKMKHARLIHLQRVAQPDLDLRSIGQKADVQELSRRIGELEAHIADSTTSSAPSKDGKEVRTAEINNAVRISIQPQLDALNRAVRRYEKRSTSQAIQTEARFNDLEVRLKDALSLAAAAARSGQKPGVIAVALEWISSFFMFWLMSLWALFIYPFQLAAASYETAKLWIFGRKPPPKRGRSSKSDEHGAFSGPRIQSRGGRA